MAIISGNGSKGHHAFDLEVNEVSGSESIQTNSSDVTFTFKIRARTAGYNWSNWKSKISYTININDVTYTGTIPSYNGSSTVTLKSGTQTIPHNNDGSKTIDISFSVTDTTGVTYTCGNASASGTLALTTIPRASTIGTITGGTLGQQIEISITRMSTSFTNVVKVKYGSKTQTISSSATDSASGTLDITFADEIPSNTSVTAQVEVTTMNNGNQVGDPAYKTFTMTVPSSVVPTISSVAKSDTSNLLATYGAYVQGKSTLRVKTTAAGAYSSTITNCLVKLKSGSTQLVSKTGTDVSFANITYTGSITIEVTVTDSRGRTATNTSTVSIAAYNNPSISLFTAERLNNDSTVTLKYSAAITNINSANANSKKFEIYKRQAGTSSWGTAIVSYTSGYTFSSSSYTTTCDANYAWEFKLEATDSFNTSSPTTNITDVGTAFELVNYGSNGTSIGFGKVAEKSNSFECDLDVYTESINKDGSKLTIYGENIVGSIRTKNILNIPNTTYSNNGITATITDGKIVTSGTYSSITSFTLFVTPITLKAGITYTLSKNQSNSGHYPYVLLRDANDNNILGTSYSDYVVSYTPTTDVTITKIGFYIGSADGVGCTLYPQLEQSGTRTDYTEYKGIGYRSGQNPYGYYQKFDDGTLIQWGRVTISYSAANTWYNVQQDFPIQFAGTVNDIAISLSVRQSNRIVNLEHTCTTSAITVYFNAVSNGSSTVTYIAIGRWK